MEKVIGTFLGVPGFLQGAFLFVHSESEIQNLTFEMLFSDVFRTGICFTISQSFGANSKNRIVALFDQRAALFDER